MSALAIHPKPNSKLVQADSSDIKIQPLIFRNMGGLSAHCLHNLLPSSSVYLNPCYSNLKHIGIRAERKYSKRCTTVPQKKKNDRYFKET